MKLGISLGLLSPLAFESVALEAERLGFESLWLPEHLVFPMEMSGSPHPGEAHPPISPTTKLFDVFGYLCFLAGRTSRIRLGTNVYLLGLRHPFVAARSIQTLDIVSGGRAEVGVGAGWLREEWRAAGLDPTTRGRRLDEALAICKRLWSEPEVAHAGEYFAFDAVAFEPKPVQRPHPPLHAGGESEAALRRAARGCDGWLGLQHTPESVGEPVARLEALRREAGRSDAPFEVAISVGAVDRDTVHRFEDAGVTRLVATPWRRSRDALDGLRHWAETVLG